MKVKGKAIEGRYERTITIERKALNDETRTVELSFSSEEPYERWFGTEILGHDDGEVDLTRLNSGTHPLLLQHNENQQIGVIEKAWVGEDKKGRAIARFAPSTNKLAEEVWQDVKAGIRSLVSVGYEVKQFRKEEQLGEDGKVIEDQTVYRATRWLPFENSIVAIPADPSVGLFRSDKAPAEDAAPTEKIEQKEKKMDNDIEKAPVTDALKEQMKAEQEAQKRAEAEARAAEERKAVIARQAERRVQEIFATT
jgi:phage head maturation protease